MDQTPAHEHHNPDLLKLIPPQAVCLIEIGCSSGALAREFKKINSRCHYFGIDINPSYVDLARRHCDEIASLDIDSAGEDFFAAHSDRDCWIFGDTLEHLKDPWRVLRAIRANLPISGCVVACIPNAQHWSVVTRLALGDFRYEDSGLLDRTHLRWFTRQTIIELFSDCGFAIVAGESRIFPEPKREPFLAAIGQLAAAAGFDPEVTKNDALALQYVVRAVPV